MSKRIQRDIELYIAPGLLGKYDNDIPIIIDEENDNTILDPTNLDVKITIYEREVKEWFLKPALSFLENESFDNSFIVLMVCMSYIEGVEQYKTGVDSNRRSKECFIDSMNRLYPDSFSSQNLNSLYSKTRCGLFHNGMVKGGVIFNNGFPDSFEFGFEGQAIKINPTMLLYDLIEDFTKYITELQKTDPSNETRILRENFDRLFTVL